MTRDRTAAQGVIRDVAGNVTDGFTCNVLSGGALYPDCPVGIAHLPRPDDTVALLFVGSPGAPWIVGCTTPRPYTLDVPLITVVPSPPGTGWSEATAVYTADGDDTQPTIRLVRPVTPAPAPGGSKPFDALDSRTWDGINDWRDSNRDVYQGSGAAVGFNTSSKGLWFYGTGIADVLPSATVTRLQITVHRDTRGGRADVVPLRFQLHGYATQPAGEPSFIDSFDAGQLSWGATNTFDLPPAWGQALADGTARGIGIYSTNTGDYSIYLGPDRDTASGRLTITYT